MRQLLLAVLLAAGCVPEAPSPDGCLAKPTRPCVTAADRRGEWVCSEQDACGALVCGRAWAWRCRESPAAP